MKTTIVLLGVLAFGSLNAHAQTQSAAVTPSAKSVPSNSAAAKPAIDPTKEKDIRRLLEVAGTKDRMVALMDGMEQNIKPLMQKALPPGDYRDKLVDAFFVKFHSKLDLTKLLDLAVPLYDQYFSDQEIKGLIAFYESPLGQKAARTTPVMTNELMAQGQKMGEELGRQSMLEVLAEHPEFEKALEDAQKATGQAPKQ